ncbi:MAG: YceI family protein [Pseudomonadota bacterium]
MRSPIVSLLLLALLAGCTSAPPALAPAPVVAQDTGAVWYQRAAAAGQQVLGVDAARSLITIVVRRGGPMARFGHDHVIASRSLSGFVAPDAGRADLHFRLDQMTVDETALRSQAGLDTQPDADAIEGTRKNMLTRVLEAERYPVVLLQIKRLGSAGAGTLVRLSVMLHGVTRSVDVPVQLQRSAKSLTASGTLRLKQSDFGITPLSIFGGAMSVQDEMELAFTIVARTA